VLVTVACGFAVAAFALASSAIRGGETSRSEEQAAQAVPAAPSAEIGLLQRRRIEADAVTADVASSPVAEMADLQQARRVPLAAASQGWLAPGRHDSVCFVRNGHVSCPPLATLAAEDVAVAITKDESGVRVDGIAVDGVQEVTLRLADGRQLTKPVSQNTFAFSGLEAEHPVEAVWSGPHGEHNQPLPDLSARGK
jgi:hypothetical protein